MFSHKVTQEEITKAKKDGNKELLEQLCSKWVKQHKNPKYKRFFNWIYKNLPLLDLIIACIGVILAILALLK